MERRLLNRGAGVRPQLSSTCSLDILVEFIQVEKKVASLHVWVGELALTGTEDLLFLESLEQELEIVPTQDSIDQLGDSQRLSL